MAKRETNAERRERECKRADLVWAARGIAVEIMAARKNPPSKNNFAALGQIFCICDANLLRTIADMLEGAHSIRDVFRAKPHPYSPGNDWYDAEIGAAYIKAFGNVWRTLPRDFSPDDLPDSALPWPTFSEFLDIFREQNPQLRGASNRSLRRSLQRLGYRTSPDKRGRPRGKRDRKPRVTR
jgi:hypothetical protein